MNSLQNCPPHRSYVASLPWEIQKKLLFNIIIYILQITYVTSEVRGSNCCSAALAVYVLLFSAFYYLHSPRTASGACYRRSACIDNDMLRFTAAANCCDMG